MALLGRQWRRDGPDTHGEAVSGWQADKGGGEKKYRRQQAEPEAKVANNVCKWNYLSKTWATQNSQVALNWGKAIVILPPLLLSDPHMP